MTSEQLEQKRIAKIEARIQELQRLGKEARHQAEIEYSGHIVLPERLAKRYHQKNQAQ